MGRQLDSLRMPASPVCSDSGSASVLSRPYNLKNPPLQPHPLPLQVLPLLASHNTVRLRFDLEAADYLHLYKPDASFPHCQVSMCVWGGGGVG